MGPSPFWAHIGWGNAEPGEVSSEQTLVEVRTGSLPLSCYVCFCLSHIALLLALSFAHTDGRKMHCLADRVSWIGTLSSSSISPRWSTLWTAQRERGCEWRWWWDLACSPHASADSKSKAGLQQPSDLEGCLSDANGFPSFTAELQGQSESALN